MPELIKNHNNNSSETSCSPSQYYNFNELVEQYDNLQKELNHSFRNARNIEEANNWASENLNIQTVNYRGFNINAANILNQELFILQHLFPEVVSNIKHVERSDNLLKRQVVVSMREKIVSDFKYEYERAEALSLLLLDKKIDLKDVESFDYKIVEVQDESYPHSSDFEVAGKGKKRLLGRLGNACIDCLIYSKAFYLLIYSEAFYLRNTEYEGIYIGPRKSKDAKNIKSILYHEFGHPLYNYLQEHKMDDFIKSNWEHYRKGLRGIVKGRLRLFRDLSFYAGANKAELFSEAISETFINKQPKVLAQKITHEALQALKLIRQNDSTC